MRILNTYLHNNYDYVHDVGMCSLRMDHRYNTHVVVEISIIVSAAILGYVVTALLMKIKKLLRVKAVHSF